MGVDQTALFFGKSILTAAERDRNNDNEAKGIVPHLFSFKGGSLERARSELPKPWLCRN